MTTNTALSVDEADLIRRYPLAWAQLADSRGPYAVAIPMTAAAAIGCTLVLHGHVPRRTRVAETLRTEAPVLLLFLGPNGYVSPSWLRDRTRAPTWNFASVQLQATVTVRDDMDILDSHLRTLTELLEAGRADAWQVSEMGARYTKLCRHIVAIEARVVSVASRFKLGQDEPDSVYADIMRSLNRGSSAELFEYMLRFNPGRSRADYSRPDGDH